MEIDQTELDEKRMKRYLRQKAEILQEVELYQLEIAEIKQKKKDTPKRIELKEDESGKGMLTVVNDQRKLINTIKMIAYWAESSLANQIRPLMKNPQEARALIRSIYNSSADFKVDQQNKKLHVLMHHSNFASVDHIIRELFNCLNETQTVLPGSDLVLNYNLVSGKFQE
jgi:hypothetical protein